MNTSHYALIEQQGLFYCFSLRNGQWHAIPLHGEQGTDTRWEEAFQALNEIHNSSKQLQDTQLVLIAETLNAHTLAVIAQSLPKYRSEQWQLHSLGWLSHWLPEHTLEPALWFAQQLLPSVITPETALDDALNSRKEPATATDDKDQEAQTPSELQAMQTAYAELKQQYRTQTGRLNTLQEQYRVLEQQPGELAVNKLCSYLPCIFENYWNHIKPVDFAVLTGAPELPSITSPVAEPSHPVIRRIARELRDLPHTQQQQLIWLVERHQTSVPTLKTRAEFQYLLEESGQ